MEINAIYGQSGGPTTVINASLYGVIEECRKSLKIDNLFAMNYGIKGLIDDDIFNTDIFTSEDLNKLSYTPGAICGSVRYHLKDYNEDSTDYLKILDNLKKHHIRYIFLNGGNDSMDTCAKISSFLRSSGYQCQVIGIPKTIDNDLYGTDHTPGYGSAAKFIATTIQAISYDNDCYQKGRVNLVEIMGRDTGWLTASASLAGIEGHGPDLIYVPEIAFDLSKFLHDVNDVYNKKGRCLVAVSEGIRDHNKKFIQPETTLDVFNHFQLGGVSRILASHIEKELGLSTRAIELSLLQRCFAPLSAECDRKEAIQCGREAVKKALAGKSDIMVTMKRKDQDPYAIEYDEIALSQVANTIAYLPRDMMNEEGNYVSDKYIKYIIPLIDGKLALETEDGLFRYCERKDR